MTLRDYDGYFSFDSDGNISFTELGITEHRSYFGKAGIDIRTVKTLDDYYLARRTASPFFNEHLVKRLAKLENSFEKRLLLAIAEDDDKEPAFSKTIRCP
jgi:hypothetical protein